MMAPQPANRTAELGYKLPRSVPANLKNERRDRTSVAELLILAAALDVPPVGVRCVRRWLRRASAQPA